MEEILNPGVIIAIPSAIKRLVGDILNPKEWIDRIRFYTGTVKGVEEGKTDSSDRAFEKASPADPSFLEKPLR